MCWIVLSRVGQNGDLTDLASASGRNAECLFASWLRRSGYRGAYHCHHALPDTPIVRGVAY